MVVTDLPDDLAHGDEAGERRRAVDENGARPALAHAAAKLRAVEPELIAEHVQQRLVGIPRIGGDAATVDAEGVGRHVYGCGAAGLANRSGGSATLNLTSVNFSVDT